MTTDASSIPPTLHLAAGLDRALAWREGGSVRHLVAELWAETPTAAPRDLPALNLAIVIDVSGSMAGEKLEAARKAAADLSEGLRPIDRLTLIAFANEAELLLDARSMDETGRAAAQSAVARLATRGMTNLSAGWLLGAEHLAIAMEAEPQAAHRLLLLSDGQANQGITDPTELARHAGELLARGIITSAVGIGDGYDEALLGGMADAGGGQLHDVAHASEIGEVVLGELRDGRAAVLERVRLRITVPASIRAEVIGPWSHSFLPGTLDVTCGTLLPGQTRRIVVRLHCPPGIAGETLRLGVAASGDLPDAAVTPSDAGGVEADPVEVGLCIASGRENNAQPRDLDRSLTVLRAWQAAVLRKSAMLNRERDRRAARGFIERELRWFQRYATGVPEAEPMVAELVLLLHRAEDEWSERTRKEVFAASIRRGKSEEDRRSAAPASLRDVLSRTR